jgi:transposase InsO family protein
MIKEDYGIKPKTITVRNPRANASVERVHQVIGNIIRTFELETSYMDDSDPWKGVLSATALAVRSTFHTTLRKKPWSKKTNWEFIREKKQTLIETNMNLKMQNASLTHML